MNNATEDAYRASSIDWRRLRKYAERVARETKAPRATTTVNGFESVDEIRRGFFGRTRTVQVATPFSREERLDYWVLDSRFIRKTWRLDARNTTAAYERYEYCLRGDGRLVVRGETYDEFEGPRFNLYYQEGTHSNSEGDFTDRDVELFDFERGYLESTRTYPHVHTDNIPGRRRIAHNRGVGLSLRLKKLLEQAPD